jgi:hypothetical protein
MSASRPFRNVSNSMLSNWHKAQQNVGRLRQIQANFNMTRDANRNHANLVRAERRLANITNRITGMQRRAGIQLNRNMNRERVMAALVREVRNRTQEAITFLRSMTSPRSLMLRQTGRMSIPMRHLHFLD